MNLKEELEKRGYLYQFTNENLFEIYDKGSQSLYFGVDPSSDSMQMGNMIALMNAFQFMLRGNKLYLLVGGATGMIGNPTGKDKERNFLDLETIQKNQDGIKKQFEFITKNVEKITGRKFDFEIINNYDFFKDMNTLSFLREVGKYMTVNWMMNKEIVKKRIQDPDKSISYAEFSYMLLMGYDYYVLYKDKGVKLEVGGSDEWDGILAGIELVGKKCGGTAYGMTNPLIMDSTGKKFGKSEGNAIWLSQEKNSPYYVYQYFLNIPDNDVGKFLKLLTFESLINIEKIVQQHTTNPSLRYGQKQLGKLVIEIVFGQKEYETVEKITNILFGENNNINILNNLSDIDIDALYRETGGVRVGSEIKITDLMIKSGLVESKTEAKKNIESGSVYLNEKKIIDINQEFKLSDFINNKIALIRKGKKNYKTILKD